MRNRISEIIEEKCKDGKRHSVRTTGLPKLWIDGIQVYVSKKYSLTKAAGVGFVLGLLIGHFITILLKY